MEKQEREKTVRMWVLLLRKIEAGIEENEAHAGRVRDNLRKMTGCDCVGLGFVCDGHDKGGPAQPPADERTA